MLDLVGDATGSAMARCVSVPLARGVTDILTGATSPGLHCAVEARDDVRRWLTFLGEHGIPCRFHQR